MAQGLSSRRIVLPSGDVADIRPMQEADLEQVHEIDRRSFSLPWPPRSFHFELIENKVSLTWTAEVELADGSRRVAGMIVVWLIEDEAHIATIAVHHDFRRQGIGRELLRVALQESIAKGAVTATLEVRAGNEAAQALYRDFGFDVVGSRPNYYRDNSEDALLMSIHDLDRDYLEWLDDEP